jgi:electron transfer flavoprotein-quinone oxidoreductase
MIGNLMKDIYAVPAGPKSSLYPTLRKHMGLSELWNIFKDLREVMKI